MCEFTVPALSGGVVLDNLELPRGWGYALINQVSFRYGGSSSFFLSGDQLLQNALRRQSSRSSADDILTLAGNFANGSGGGSNNLDYASGQSAAVVLTLPHSTPSGVGKAHPFPSDLLTQQVQVTVELKPLAQIFGILAAGGAPALALIPNALSFAQFQVQQVMLNNQGDALARRVDMAQNVYAYPCEFVQQVQRLPLQNSSGSQSVALTGFRSGEVKAIHCWLNNSADLENAGNSPSGGMYNPWNWELCKSIQMSYAGDVYARYDNGSSSLWALVNGNKSPAFDTVYSEDGGAVVNVVPALSQWHELPFSQTMVDEDSKYVLVHGKPITNGIVNLDLVTPYPSGSWVLNVSYIYNTTIAMSGGTADFVY